MKCLSFYVVAGGVAVAATNSMIPSLVLLLLPVVVDLCSCCCVRERHTGPLSTKIRSQGPVLAAFIFACVDIQHTQVAKTESRRNLRCHSWWSVLLFFVIFIAIQ